MNPPLEMTLPWPPQWRQVSRVLPLATPVPPHSGQLDAALGAEDGLLEVDLQVETQVVAALCAAARAPPLSAAEHVAEHAAAEETAQQILQIRHVGEIAGEVEAAGPEGRLHALVAELVVTLPFVGVAQNLVSLRDLLELFRRVLVAGIAVGMILHCQLAVGLLDLVSRGAAADAKKLVIVSFCGHGV